MTMAPSGRVAEQSTPVEVRFGTSEKQRRLTVLFRLILVIPQLIVLIFIGFAAEIVVIVGWFAALITGRLPEGMANFVLGAVRWSIRVYAYYFLLTDVYPPFSLDPDPNYPVDVLVTTGRLNRVAVLFRIVLLIPAYVVSIVFTYGMVVFGFITWLLTLILGKMPDALFGASAAAIRYQARFSGYVAMLTSVYPGGVLGDKAPDGRPYEGSVSGTVAPMPPPPGPPGAWMPGQGQTPAWGAQPGIATPVPPPPPVGGYTPPPAPAGAYSPPPLQPPPASGADIPPPVPGTAPPPPPPPVGGYTEPLPVAGEAPPLPPPPPVSPTTPGWDATIPAMGTLPPPPPPPPYAGVGPVGPMPPPPSYAAQPFGGGPPRFWPLMLAKSARVMAIVFIVVGAIAYIAFLSTSRIHFSVNSIESSVAAVEVQSAYNTLDAKTQTFRASTQACTGPSQPALGVLACLETADSTWASAIQDYSTQLGQISFPSSAQSDADAARAAADNAVSVVQSLAASPDAESYSSASSSPEFTSALNAVDSTYNQLVSNLQGG